MLLSLLACASALHQPRPVSRRVVAGGLLGLPAALLPRPAHAGPFNQGPLSELGGLRGVKDKLVDLSEQMSKGYGDSEEEAIVVLRTSSIYFSDAAKTMSKAVEAMPLLSSDERSKTLDLSRQFDEKISSLKEACRQASSKDQLAAASSAKDALADYLSIAALHYTVPDFQVVPYSSSESEFSAQVMYQAKLCCPTTRTAPLYAIFDASRCDPHHAIDLFRSTSEFSAVRARGWSECQGATLVKIRPRNRARIQMA